MPSRSKEAFLRAMALRYGWDMNAAEAAARPDKVIYRVMDLGVLDDILDMERVFGRPRLAAILRRMPPGAMCPRSWWFWHYRLHLADAEHDPPPMPVRTFAVSTNFPLAGAFL